MEVLIAVLSGISFASMVYLGVYFRLKKKKKLEMLDWFLLSIATFNGVGFGFVVWATHEGRNPVSSFSQVIMSFDSSMVFTYIMLNVVLLFSVLSGWLLTTAVANEFALSDRILSTYKEQWFLKSIVFVAWLMFIIAVIAYWLYTKPYGGFIEYLAYSRAIRSGVFTIENRFSFLIRFGSLSFFSSFIFYALLIDKENKNSKKLIIFIGFILSVLFSLYVLYSWVGRVRLAGYIATFFLGFILYSYKSVFAFVRKTSFFSILSIFLLVYADVILARSGGTLGIISLFTKELSFPFVTYYSVVNSSQYRWFIDIIVSPLYILPMSVWSGLFNIETASSFNTFLVSGARKGEVGVYGEMPVDLLSFSYMQGNLLGVLIVGLIWGCTLYILQRMIYKIPTKSIRSIINANLIFSACIMSVLYGDPQNIVVRNFEMIFAFLVVWFFMKIGFKKQRKMY